MGGDLMPMPIGSIEIDFEPGSTYDEGPQAKYQSKESGRQDAVDKMKKAVQKTTMGQLDGACRMVLALAIQLRSVGGSAAGTDIPKVMREAIDFLEDI
jgi:hypothetical protein